MKNTVHITSILFIVVSISQAGGCRQAISPREYPRTTADRFIEHFPDSIPNTSDISKFPVPESRFCLIHIRQIHYLPFHRVLDECHAMLKRIPDDPFYDDLRASVRSVIDETRIKNRTIYRAINDCQSDIYHLALYLRDQWQIRALRTEGLFMQVNWMEFREEYRHRLQNVLATDIFTDASEIPYLPGADLMLAMNQELTVRDCDSFTAVQLAGNDMDARFNQREDHVLRIIANYSDPVVPVIFGGDHHFYDNIINWNRKNPFRRFSLIEITPTAYPQDTGDYDSTPQPE